LEDRDFSQNQAELTAATNVFVAITRPRYMLSLAIRKEAASAAMVAAAQAQGWQVLDLTLGNAMNKVPTQ
jgi:hypothetical protein